MKHGVIKPNGDVFLVQERYARDVVKRFNMEGSKSVSTPSELGNQLDSSQQPASDEEKEEEEPSLIAGWGTESCAYCKAGSSWWCQG